MSKYFLLTLFIASASYSQTSNRLSEKEKKQGWELLFNGNNLEGWTKMNGKSVEGWKVIEGVLNNSGIGSDHGGDIISTNQYKDFELYLEWRIDHQSNSGVFYHVDPSKSKVIFKTGPEYQLLDDKGWPTKLKSSQYTGANYAMNTPRNSSVKPVGQWNTTRIVVKGAKVKHFLNGKKVVQYKFWTKDWFDRKSKSKWKNAQHYGMAKQGHIGFQDHGGLTQFRNIKIKRL